MCQYKKTAEIAPQIATYVILMLFWGCFDKEYKFVLVLITKCIKIAHLDMGIQICHPDDHVTTNIDINF